MRIVGQMSVSSDQDSADEEQIGALGLTMVTDTALAVGITAFPDPVTDVAADTWFMYQSFAQSFRFISGTGFDSINSMTYKIDSRGKRILEDGEVIVIIAANAHVTHGLKIAFPFRLLAQVRGTR